MNLLLPLAEQTLSFEKAYAAHLQTHTRASYLLVATAVTKLRVLLEDLDLPAALGQVEDFEYDIVAGLPNEENGGEDIQQDEDDESDSSGSSDAKRTRLLSGEEALEDQD